MFPQLLKKKNAKEEVGAENALIKRIDPTGEFTLLIKKQCNIGRLDRQEESIEQFRPCLNNVLRDYDYPFDGYRSQNDLTLLISPAGVRVTAGNEV